MRKEISFKELKKSDYENKTINQEIQDNLIARIKAKQPVFEGLFGYEDTVFYFTIPYQRANRRMDYIKKEIISIKMDTKEVILIAVVTFLERWKSQNQ